ncbi:MAG: hypothetical protein HQL16_02715 [Candidatus Omnitrophica bacterium]|nr:hypothetical protein [Candidatus Omnitrophota bacterium]
MSISKTNLEVVFAFESLRQKLEEESGGPVHLVKIVGPRWSYVAGTVPEELPCVVPERVILNDDWALMFYPAHNRAVDSQRIRELFLRSIS